jgi:two-component system, chemotaxis family, chemotaxis protein CheY
MVKPVTASRAPWTALVVEPDRQRALMLTELLRELGCAEITVVRDSDGAMSQLEYRAPRIVLCAARMAPVDGFEFARTFRRAPGMRSNEVSTVLTFSGVDRSDILNALNAGADSILSFPMSKAQLGNMLHLLDTQKRPFVRSATYVGPCRRRGLVGDKGGRRLEDFGAPEALAAMVETLRKLFKAAQVAPIGSAQVDEAALSLAAFLRAARSDRAIDEAALSSQCRALVRQFADHAPGAKSFDHVFAPLRKLLISVVLKDVKPGKAEAVAA